LFCFHHSALPTGASFELVNGQKARADGVTAQSTSATINMQARSEPRRGIEETLPIDDRASAHTGARDDEGGKIRGMLARGQDQRICAHSYSLACSLFAACVLAIPHAPSSASLRIRSSRTRFTRRRDASSTVPRTESFPVMVSP